MTARRKARRNCWRPPARRRPAAEKAPPTPLTAIVDLFASLADEARRERRKLPSGSFEDGEAHGRFEAYRNAAARLNSVVEAFEP